MAGLARTGRILAVALIPWVMTGCAGTGSRWSQLTSRSAEDQERTWARAQACEKDGRLAEAQQLYGELYRRDPKSPRYAHRLGVVSTMLGDHDRAKSAYTRARELDPENSDLLADMGYAAFLRNEYAEAETLLRGALALSGDNVRAKTNLALAVGLQGRYDECQALFREVHGQDEAEVLCNLAYVKSQRGDVAGATELYKQALAIDPSVKKASIALAELKSARAKGEHVAHGKPYRKYMNENAPKPPQPRQSATEVAAATSAATLDVEVKRSSEREPPQTTLSETKTAVDSEVTLTAKSEAKKTPATPATWESAPAPAKAPVATRAIPEEEAAASVQRRSAPMPAETTVGKATVEASTTFVGAPALEETLELTDESSEGWHSVSSDGVEPCGPRCLADRTGQIAARRGQVGLMGFCPVALRDEQKLVDALPQHVAEYQSQKYQFSTAEAVEKFRADPERYLPAAGGLDVVAVGQGTAVALGSLEHAVWFRHKLYLFLTRENMELFRTQARQFAVQQ